MNYDDVVACIRVNHSTLLGPEDAMPLFRAVDALECDIANGMPVPMDVCTDEAYILFQRYAKRYDTVTEWIISCYLEGR